MSGPLEVCRDALAADLDDYPFRALQDLRHCLEGLSSSLNEVHADTTDRQARQDLLSALNEALEGDG